MIIATKSAHAALVGLALCVLAIGTGEYVVAGMLPAVSAGLGVSVAATGQLITAYAATVMLAGPPITAWTARRQPKGLLMVLMAVFVVGTLICSVATSFPIMIIGRIMAGLVHCTVFAVSLVVATTLVPPQRTSSAIAVVASGLTFAIVLAVPLGTVVEAHGGWRVTFMLVAALGIVGLIAVALTLPRQPRPNPEPIRAQLRTLIQPAIAKTYLLTVLGYAGVFATFTYLAPFVQDEAGTDAFGVTLAVTAFGLGGVIGNIVASRTADTRPRETLLSALIVLTVSLAVLPFTTSSFGILLADVFLFGAAAFATVPTLQTRVISLASGAPTLAAAVNAAAFNLANTIGAAIGGVVVATAGLMWTAPAGAVITQAGLLLAAKQFRPSLSSATATILR